MEWTLEGLISTVCTRDEHVNLKVLSGQRLCAVRFRQRRSAVIQGESPATRTLLVFGHVGSVSWRRVVKRKYRRLSTQNTIVVNRFFEGVVAFL